MIIFDLFEDDNKKLQGVSEDGTNFRAHRVPELNRSLPGVSTAAQKTSQVMNLKQNQPYVKRLIPSPTGHLQISVDSQMIGQQDGGAIIRGNTVDTSARRAYTKPWSIHIDHDGNIIAQDLGRLNNDELSAIEYNLVTRNRLLQPNQIAHAVAESRVLEEKQQQKKHDHSHQDPLLTYHGKEPNVRKVLARAYKETPGAKNDIEAVFGHIANVDEINRQQQQQIIELAKKLIQAQQNYNQQEKRFQNLTDKLRQQGNQPTAQDIQNAEIAGQIERSPQAVAENTPKMPAGKKLQQRVDREKAQAKLDRTGLGGLDYDEVQRGLQGILDRTKPRDSNVKEDAEVDRPIPAKSVIHGYTVFWDPRTRTAAITRGGHDAEAALAHVRVGMPLYKNFLNAVTRKIDQLDDELSQGVTEMDKSQKSPAGWNLDDYDYSKGNWTRGKIVTAKDAVKDMGKELNRAFNNTDPKDKEPGVTEGNDDNKIYDRGYRDGFAGKPKNDKVYDGNAWASYRAGYLDGKQAAKSKQGVAEGVVDPQRKKAGKIINRCFGKISEYEDDGWEYLDSNAPVWNNLFNDDQYDGDIDAIIANAPIDLLVKSAKELMDVVSDLPYELDEQGVAETAPLARDARRELVAPTDRDRIRRELWKYVRSLDQEGMSNRAHAMAYSCPTWGRLYRQFNNDVSQLLSKAPTELLAQALREIQSKFQEVAEGVDKDIDSQAYYIANANKNYSILAGPFASRNEAWPEFQKMIHQYPGDIYDLSLLQGHVLQKSRKGVAEAFTPGQNSPYDCGGADSEYGRRYNPHKVVNNDTILLTDPAERAEYRRGWDEQERMGGAQNEFRESETDFSKRRKYEKSADQTNQPKKPRQPSNDYFARRAKEKRDLERFGEGNELNEVSGYLAQEPKPLTYPQRIRRLVTLYQAKPAVLGTLAREKGADSDEQIAFDYIRTRKLRPEPVAGSANVNWNDVVRGITTQPTLHGQDLLNAAATELKKMGYGTTPDTRDLMNSVINGAPEMHRQLQSAYDKKIAKTRELAEDQDTEGVERAILHRIMVGHKDLLLQYGPQRVMQAVEEVAYNVGDVDEIGTSDVSAWIHQVKQILGAVAEAKAVKTRLDPACWTGKRIGTPKTKVKGGVRVNNCVPK